MDDIKLKKNIEYFRNTMPYKQEPYSKKTWGNKLHSLCSYQGKLKPSIAYWLINLFTEEGDIVLDPLGGVATIPLEACLQGREGITNDISPFAATVGAAKVSLPKRNDLEYELEKIRVAMETIKLDEKDMEEANFGLNSEVKDYFHPDTLIELLKIRKYLLINWEWSDAQNFIRANLLHILHGNRPYALSRLSHSLTPFSPKGDYIYKPVYEKLVERIDKSYNCEITEKFKRGKYFYGSYELLPNKLNKKVDVIITSPPFVGMRFDRPNWMRLWLCGWNNEDFLKTSLSSLDRKQSQDWDVYITFFKTCHNVIKDDGLLVLHLGGSKKYDMVTELILRSKSYFELIDIVSEDVSGNEKHGIKDKGTTNSHKYIFMKKI